MAFSLKFLQLCTALGVFNYFCHVNGENSNSSRHLALRTDKENHQSHTFHFFFPGHEGISHSTEKNDEIISRKSLWLGHIPLFFAVKNGFETIVDALIEQNASVNVKDEDGWTPLHWAVFHGLDFI